MIRFNHSYPYDPSYGYGLDDLLAVPLPLAPADFAQFWQQRYHKTTALRPQYTLTACGSHAGYQVFDLNYQSTVGVTISGWLLKPEQHEISSGIVIGHGYGGRDQPDYHLQIPGAALLFPCFRGLARSRMANVSEQPNQHIVTGIDNPQNYILGGCVDDLWLAVSVLLDIFPQTSGHIGYMGISFGGGIGAIALPWDKRINRAHFNVPSFGNQPLRLSLPTIGSATGLKSYAELHGNILDTLAYYDAAVAASYAMQPGHFALAVFDPVVAPPGQFAIYNHWAADKSLFILDAGHFEYPNRSYQEQLLLAEIMQFFGEASP